MDWEFTKRVLDGLNAGTIIPPDLQFDSFPGLGGDILDLRAGSRPSFQRDRVESVFAHYLPGHKTSWTGIKDQMISPTEKELENLGLALIPVTAFGLLNGGMATSYTDTKKNQSFGPDLYTRLRIPLEQAARDFGHLPKGMTPAFFQQDNFPGPTYLELKVRHLLMLNAAARMQGHHGPGLQLFQMTSQNTDAAIRNFWTELNGSAGIKEWLEFSPIPLISTPTAVQELVGTFTSAASGTPRQLFLVGNQGESEPYALPAGHGQNFRVLGPVYRDLEKQGYQFVYLGNIDNLGYLPSLKGLAVLALRGSPAAFDFSFKTKIDVKGGVLYQQTNGKLNCADIGVAIDREKVSEADRLGTPILFNCATGLFDLRKLTKNLDHIVEKLPIRISEQDKDVGRYAQAEQITWEVIGLLEHPLISGVEKNRRFLAAKLLLDCFLTSGLLGGDQGESGEMVEFASLSRVLNEGLNFLMEGPLAYHQQLNRWVPRSRNELEATLKTNWRFLSV
jgi:hypothetical protein